MSGLVLLQAVGVAIVFAVAALPALNDDSSERASPAGAECGAAGAAATRRPDVVDSEAASVQIDARDGLRALRARYSGAGLSPLRPGYGRVVRSVSWRPGDTVVYAACFFLPTGFGQRMQGQVALMRWDDYPSEPAHAVQGGIVVNEPGARGQLMRDRKGAGEQVALTSPFQLPEGRWFELRVRQRLGLSAATARSEVFLDGRLIRSSRLPNLEAPTEVSRLRFGLVALSFDQRDPLAVWFRQLLAFEEQQ